MARVRGVYGKPWSKMAGDIPLSQEVLARLGQTLLEEVIREGKKDLAKQGNRPTPRGEPEGIPATDNFWESFDYHIRGDRTIEITSEWDWIEQILEGRNPYPMTWSTRARGVYRVPMIQPNGTVLIRMAPLSVNDAWIHPGFARHTFVNRGVKKGREKMAKIIMEEAMAMLSQGDPFR
jgi:hypothetical protein